jgi:hypothetical protein
MYVVFLRVQSISKCRNGLRNCMLDGVCVGVPSLTLQECANALTHSILSPHAYLNLSSYPCVYLLICVLLGLILFLDSSFDHSNFLCPPQTHLIAIFSSVFLFVYLSMSNSLAFSLSTCRYLQQ